MPEKKINLDPEKCDHRGCAIMKLIVLSKMAATLSKPGDSMSPEDITMAGLRSLVALGVSEEEIFTISAELVMMDAMTR